MKILWIYIICSFISLLFLMLTASDGYQDERGFHKRKPEEKKSENEKEK